MNYIQTLNDIKNYYANLLIVQYNGKTKAVKTIKLLAALLYINMVLLQIRDAFDWKSAQGPQLDIVGDWVKASRFYKGQLFDFHPWFSLIDWNTEPDNMQGGFSTFDNFDELFGGFLEFRRILPTQNKLNDEFFRLLIGLKIIKNSIPATCKNIDDAIWEYFNGRVYTLWDTNELTYYFPSELAEIMHVAETENVLPCPTGVRIELKEIIDNG